MVWGSRCCVPGEVAGAGNQLAGLSTPNLIPMPTRFPLAALDHCHCQCTSVQLSVHQSVLVLKPYA